SWHDGEIITPTVRLQSGTRVVRDSPGSDWNWRWDPTKRCFRSELFRPIDPGRGRHQQRQGNNGTNSDRKPGETFEKEAVTEQDHVSELRHEGQAGETSSCRSK